MRAKLLDGGFCRFDAALQLGDPLLKPGRVLHCRLRTERDLVIDVSIDNSVGDARRQLPVRSVEGDVDHARGFFDLDALASKDVVDRARQIHCRLGLYVGWRR